MSRPITSPFYAPASLAYRGDLVMAHAFDLDKASRMLEAAGAKGLQLTTNVTPRWPQMKLFMLLWQADLAKIGVKLTVNEVENAKFYDVESAKDFQDNDLHPWVIARTSRDPACRSRRGWCGRSPCRRGRRITSTRPGRSAARAGES